MPRIVKKITLTEKQYQALTRVATSRTQRQDHIERAKIILLCSEPKSNTQIGRDLNIARHTVKQWRTRWQKTEEKLVLIDKEEDGINYSRKLLEILSDEQRPGTPCKFTAEQVCQIMSVACERPEDIGLPISHWSLDALVNEVIKRGIVKTISRSRLAVFLKSGRYKTA